MVDISVGDQIKNLLATDIQKRFGSDLPPMIGAFTLIAEATDGDTGDGRFLSLTDNNLSLWLEMGMLKARLKTVEARWEKAGFDSDLEE